MSLKVAIAETTQCKKDLTIEVSAEEVKQHFAKAYQAYARQARVPGFRPGRAPLTVVKQRFKKEVQEEVIGKLVPQAIEHAVTDHKLRIVGSAEISDISCNEGEPLRFKLTVEVLPEFELKEYKGLKVIRHVARVTEEKIDQVMEQIRQQMAQLVPVEDRPSTDGDFVSVNLIGHYLEPEEKEDFKAENVSFHIGVPSEQPEFTENLRGVKPGDVRQFRVKYPEGFSNQQFAGKTLEFTATVVAVRQKELPELDDDFAREVSDCQTLQELRERVREDLQHQFEHQANIRLRADLLEQLCNAYDFPVPESLVEEQTQNRLRGLAGWALRHGVPLQELKQLDWKEQEARERHGAVRNVRGAVIMERIAEAEGIEISPAEIEAEIERLAAATHEPVEAVRARLTKDKGLASIERRLRYEKALDIVVQNAEVTTEEITENQESDLAAERAQAQPASQPAEPV